MTATPGVNDKPFGLKEIKLVSIDGITAISLPAALELEWEETVVSGEFFGNDDLQGLVTQPLGVKGKFKTGGIPLSAYALMTGHTYEVTSSTPNQIATLEGDSPTFPYFKIYGKSLGDEGDDIHVKIFKAKLTSSPKGGFKRGEFFMLEAEFQGVKTGGKAYDVVANETASALPGATGSPSAITCTPVPADEAPSIAIDDPITLTFNNALAGHADDGIILVDSDSMLPVDCTRTISSTRKVVTLTPDEDLTNEVTYLIIVPGVTDIYAQVFADTVYSFTTVAGT
jgi:hypothetical protein